jgi:hypothetical protein
MPNRMLIIENMPRSSSTDFTKVPFVRKPTLIRDPKVHVQRNRNVPKLPQPNQPTLIDMSAVQKRRPLKITARVASNDDSRQTENRPLRAAPLERSNALGSQLNNVRNSITAELNHLNFWRSYERFVCSGGVKVTLMFKAGRV